MKNMVTTRWSQSGVLVLLAMDTAATIHRDMSSRKKDIHRDTLEKVIKAQAGQAPGARVVIMEQLEEVEEGEDLWQRKESQWGGGGEER